MNKYEYLLGKSPPQALIASAGINPIPEYDKNHTFCHDSSMIRNYLIHYIIKDESTKKNIEILVRPSGEVDWG